jgi:glutamate---cysteine ligase / carboxylate-amine ligase
MNFHLFERVGVELEYMLVDHTGLEIRPCADEILRAVAGELTGEVDVGRLSWSNELVAHVIELKTNGPQPALAGLAEAFQHDVRRINALAAPLGVRLMPTAMHPWMDPLTQTTLWPHDSSPIYEAFDRIFNCKGHGWANLQSIHLNLPFFDDEEFGRLHAAIRLLLPILPALAASSPIADGHATGVADTRLEVYRSNARRIPVVTGRVIPEPVFTERAYRATILEPIYAALAPHDPAGILQHEWANARGAIARFERQTIEIRVLDIQECPAADLALLELIVAVLQALVAERWTGYAAQRDWPVTPLEQVFLAAVQHAGAAEVHDERYGQVFGYDGPYPVTAAGLWKHLFQSLYTPRQRREPGAQPLHVMTKRGSLAERIIEALGASEAHSDLSAVYRELCECLAQGTPFRPRLPRGAGARRADAT